MSRLVLALVIGLAVGVALASPAQGLVVDRIGRTVRQHTGDVRVCYVRALRLRPALSGRIVVHFTVEASGAVRDVSAERDDLGDPTLQACVLDAVRSWSFPAGTESETVSYPFVLTP